MLQIRSSLKLGTRFYSKNLLAQLHALSACPLTVVEAPMGYGKTSAVLAQLKISRAKAIWVSALDAGVQSFWRSFCRELKQSLPAGNAPLVDSLLQIGYPADPVLVDAARELLCQLDFPPRSVLVVDDAHLLPGNGYTQSGGGLSKLFERLAVQRPDNLRLILISRNKFAGSCEVLALKGLVCKLGRRELVFQPQDILEYYQQCGLNLGREQAEALFENTAGWISALYLYLLRYSKQGILDKPNSINLLLEKEVYNPLPERTKKLLLALQFVDPFTKEQADFILRAESDSPSEDSGPLLAELLAKNAFVALREESGSYVIHAIFREYLREIFHNLPQAEQESVHRKNAELFMRNGDYKSAIECFYAIKDFQAILDILDKEKAPQLATESGITINKLFQECPDEIMSRHIPAVFMFCFAALAAGDYQSFGQQLAWIGAKCAAMPQETQATRDLLGNLEYMLSLAAYNDIEAMSAHHRRAYALRGRPTDIFSPASSWTMGSPSVLFMFHRRAGELEREKALMHECMPDYYKLALNHGFGGEYLFEAEADFHVGKFEEAAIACQRAMAMAKSQQQLGNLLCGMILQARLALFGADFERCLDLLTEMRAMIREKHHFFNLRTVDLCQGLLYGLLDQPAQAPLWLRNIDDQEKRLLSFAGGYFHITQGRLLLTEGNYTPLIGQYEWLLASQAFPDNLLFEIYAHIYLACAQQALGKIEAAAASLIKALELSMPDKLYLPFVENMDFLEEGLKQLSRSGQPTPLSVQDSAMLQHLSAQWKKSKKKILGNYFTPAASQKLTKRELQLTRLALTGKTYPEIAEQLNLAPTTVKKSFSLMFRKYGLSGRHELGKLLGQDD